MSDMALGCPGRTMVRPVNVSHRHELLVDCKLQLCLGRVLGAAARSHLGSPSAAIHLDSFLKSATNQNVCLFLFLILLPFMPVPSLKNTLPGSPEPVSQSQP